MTDTTSVTECVLFDANAYLALARRSTPTQAMQTARRLREQEQQRGIVALGSHDVIIELCAHLCTPEDPEFDRCAAALCMMYVHCSQDVTKGVRLRLVPTPEDQLCEPLYGRVPPQLEHNSQQVRLAAYYVYADPSREGIAAHADNLKAIADYVAEVETAYSDMLEASMKNVDLSLPGARGVFREMLIGMEGRAMAANAIANRARVALGIEGSDPLAAYNAIWVAEAFPAAVDFMAHRFRAVFDGARPAKHGNSSWDSEFSFLIGQVCCSIDGQPLTRAVPITLVTDDREIRSAANRCNLSDRCEVLDAYRQRLVTPKSE